MLKLPDGVKYVLDSLSCGDYEAFIVGGAIRDSILGITPKDYDICTNMPTEVVKIIFDHVILTGEKHNTVTIPVGGINVEVTSFENTGDVITDLYSDLKRRDFTINAMAWSPKYLGIIDPFKGVRDITHDRVIRTPQLASLTIDADPLRVLRAIRFSCTLNFSVNHWLHLEICNQRHKLSNVSVERIRDEFVKILTYAPDTTGLMYLRRVGILYQIIPELEACDAFEQCSKHHEYSVYGHTLRTVDACPHDTVTRLAALFHDISKPKVFTKDDDGRGHFYNHQTYSADIAEEVMTRLKFDKDTISKVTTLVREHMSRHDKLRTPSIKKFINRVGEDNLPKLFDLFRADIRGSKLIANGELLTQVDNLEKECKAILDSKPPMSRKDLVINGNELIGALALEPSPLITEIFDFLVDSVIENPEYNESAKLYSLASEFLVKKGVCDEGKL